MAAILEPTERRIRLAPELTLAAIAYGSPTNPPVLCAHGWMDNAASFKFIAPALASAGFYVVCLELPGHGQSDHRPRSAHYVPVEYAANIFEAIDAMGWDRFALCGHSMGAGLAPLVAAGFPERCVGLILLEGLGPSIRPVAEAPTMFARAIAAKASSPPKHAALYTSVDEAVDQRLFSVTRYEPGPGGPQYLSREGAEALVRRAVSETEIELPASVAAAQATNGRRAQSAAASSSLSSAAGAGLDGAALSPSASSSASGSSGDAMVKVTRWRFRHDPRIKGPYLHYWHEEQVCAFMAAIKCHVLSVTATRGWPRDVAAYKNRAEILSNSAETFTVVNLPGGHHLHLDPETQGPVCEAVVTWATKHLRPAFSKPRAEPSS